MKIDNVVVISLEDYAEYQELKKQKSTADFIVTGITNNLKLETNMGFSKEIYGNIHLEMVSNGDLSHLLDDKNNVCLGKLINHLRNKTFKEDFLGKFIES